MLPTGGVAGVSVFASKVFGNFALAATADVFVSTSLSEGTPMIFSKEKELFLFCFSYPCLKDLKIQEKEKIKKTSENIWKICFKVLTFASAF